MKQPEAVRYVVEFLEREGIEYAIVGSVASMAFGESRFTNDLDVIVRIQKEHIPLFLRAFPAPDWYVSAAAIGDAIRQRRQFNAIHVTSGHKVDFLLPRTAPWWSGQLDRRTQVELEPSFYGYVSHPNDVIIGKLLFYAEGRSEKHLRDIAAMLAVSPHLISVNDIDDWAERLAVADVWSEIKTRVAEMPPLPPDFKL